LGGGVRKVAQQLGTRPDVVPEIRDALSGLFADNSPRDRLKIEKQVLQLSPRYHKLQIHQVIKSGTVADVLLVTDKDGAKMAMKSVAMDQRALFQADFKIISNLVTTLDGVGLFGFLDKNCNENAQVIKPLLIKTEDLVKDDNFVEQVMQEFSMQQEKIHMEQGKKAVAKAVDFLGLDVDGISVPETLDVAVDASIMLMELVEGRNLKDSGVATSKESALKIAKNLVGIFFHALLNGNLFMQTSTLATSSFAMIKKAELQSYSWSIGEWSCKCHKRTFGRSTKSSVPHSHRMRTWRQSSKEWGSH